MPDDDKTPAQDPTPADADKQTPAGDPNPVQKPPEEPAGKTPDTEAPPQRVVPEKYELKLPEGSLLAPEHVAEVSAFAKEKALTNDEAQAVLERENAVVASYVEGKNKETETEVNSWLEAVKTDKEIGGDSFAKNAELAKRVIEKFGSKEFKEALNSTGLGNHPELVRVFVRIGKQLAEDVLELPGNPPVEEKSLAELLYPNHKEGQ